MEWLIIVLIAGLAMGGLGGFVASQKRRSPIEGALLGALFGPLGVLVEALLPTVSDPAPRRPRPARSSSAAWNYDALNRFDEPPAPKPVSDPDEEIAFGLLSAEPEAEAAGTPEWLEEAAREEMRRPRPRLPRIQTPPPLPRTPRGEAPER